MNEKSEKHHEKIYHILPRAAWEAVKGQADYRPESLASAGFIHCSLLGQVVRVANAFYRDQQDLLLLEIVSDRLEVEVRYEDLLGEGMTFPHIYGPLNLEAVAAVYELQRDESGAYTLPDMR